VSRRILSSLTVLWLLMAASVLPVAAHSASAAITIVDDQHTTLTLAGPAQRIISLAPNVTEILFSLGLGNRVVGVSSYSTYPPAATHLPIVIDNGVPNLEKIIALKPDLLISAAIVGAPAMTKLRSLHLTVMETDPHDIPGILRDIQLVGDAAGVGGVATREVAALQRRINAVEAKVRTVKNRPTVYYELDNTFYTVGRGTFMELTVEENMRLGAYVRQDRAAVEMDFERMFGYFPRLKERFRQQAGTLSGGEQQMLAISRALLLRPRLLMLDEPSFGLAPLIVKEIFNIMRRIRDEEKVSILLVEQNASIALAFAEDAYLLETGRIVVSGKAADISKDESIRRSYLGY